LGLDYKNHVVQNPKYMRPEELRYLCGDCSKAKKILKWAPNYTFDSMIDEMIQAWSTK
jgi:GDPmannose 4,6-dehydratase